MLYWKKEDKGILISTSQISGGKKITDAPLPDIVPLAGLKVYRRERGYGWNGRSSTHRDAAFNVAALKEITAEGITTLAQMVHIWNLSKSKVKGWVRYGGRCNQATDMATRIFTNLREHAPDYIDNTVGLSGELDMMFSFPKAFEVIKAMNSKALKGFEDEIRALVEPEMEAMIKRSQVKILKTRVTAARKAEQTAKSALTEAKKALKEVNVVSS